MSYTIKDHKKHLAVVPDEYVKRKMAFFKIPKVELSPLPFECQSFSIRNPFREYTKWIHPLDPISIDDLKNWFGVPNELAKRMQTKTQIVNADGNLWSRVKKVTPKDLPQRTGWDFKSLDSYQRDAVKQVSYNLLYGYVSPESLQSPVIKGVVKHMLESTKNRTTIFAAPDLIVCPDTTAEFHNISTLYFNNILIYGNGKIKTSGITNFHAFQIKRVP